MNNRWLRKGEKCQIFCSRGLLLLLIGYLNKPKNKIGLISVILPKAYMNLIVHTLYILQYIIRTTVHCTCYSILYVLQYIVCTIVHCTYWYNCTLYILRYIVCNTKIKNKKNVTTLRTILFQWDSYLIFQFDDISKSN